MLELHGWEKNWSSSSSSGGPFVGRVLAGRCTRVVVTGGVPEKEHYLSTMSCGTRSVFELSKDAVVEVLKESDRDDRGCSKVLVVGNEATVPDDWDGTIWIDCGDENVKLHYESYKDTGTHLQ